MANQMTSTLQTDRCAQNKELEAARIRKLEQFYVVVRREIMAACSPEFARETAMSQIYCDDGLGIALKNVPSVPFNRWVGIGVDRPATEQAVDRAINWMAEHASSMWGLEVTPAASPAGLVDWIEARGLRAMPGGFATFWRDAIQVEHSPETEFVIRRADVADADVFGATAVSCFGMPASFKSWMSAFPGRPGWHTYLASRNATPVGVAAMFIEADMAWLGIDATLPAFRGQGIHGALLSTRIRDAAQNGVKLLTIETDRPSANDPPNAAYRNIERAGFVLSHSRLHYGKVCELENEGSPR
jgi:GNAT superfamily N-acetyltransferase